MAVEEFFCAVGIAVVNHRTIVAREDDEGVLAQSGLFKGGHDLADSPVELHDGIAAQAHFVFTTETLVGEAWHVDIVGSEIHEEGFLLVLVDEVDGMGGDGVGDVLVFPKRFAAALHIADAADAVDDAHVVSVARLQVVKQFRIGTPRRFAREISLIAHFYGRRRVVIGYRTIFDEHARHTVGRCSHYIGIVKTKVVRTSGKRRVPILLSRFVAQAEVPFAESGRCITSALEHIGNGELFRTDDHSRITRSDVRSRFAPGIFSRQHRIARGRRSGRSGITIGKAYAISGQTVYIWCFHILGTIAFKVSEAQIIGIDKDDVGARRCFVFAISCRLGRNGRRERQGQQRAS